MVKVPERAVFCDFSIFSIFYFFSFKLIFEKKITPLPLSSRRGPLRKFSLLTNDLSAITIISCIGREYVHNLSSSPLFKLTVLFCFVMKCIEKCRYCITDMPVNSCQCIGR